MPKNNNAKLLPHDDEGLRFLLFAVVLQGLAVGFLRKPLKRPARKLEEVSEDELKRWSKLWRRAKKIAAVAA